MAVNEKFVVKVKSYKTGETVETLCKEGASQRQAERVERGVSTNLNHDEFYTIIAPWEPFEEESVTNRLMEKYPEHIVEYVRQNLGLTEDDTSLDGEILAMSRDEVLDRVCAWNGLIGFGDTVKDWVQDVYGVELEDEWNE
jgi:hypothetical protein